MNKEVFSPKNMLQTKWQSGKQGVIWDLYILILFLSHLISAHACRCLNMKTWKKFFLILRTENIFLQEHYVKWEIILQMILNDL